MKNIYRPKFLVTALFGLLILLGAWSANPPDGRTGAPGDGICQDCHNPPGGGIDGNLEILGLPMTIAPNTTYNLTINVNNPNGAAMRGGFQLTALNSANNTIGSLSNSDANSTITVSGGRTYWEHNPSQFFGAANTLSYTADWTSPASVPTNETITLYASAVVANGNGNNGGDLVVLTNESGMMIATPDPLTVSITQNSSVSCFGDMDGSAEAQAMGGDMMYSFLWDNGETTSTAVSLSPGVHSVTVTDGNNDMASTMVTIGEPDLLEISITDVMNVTCNGALDGSLSTSVVGGTAPYEYDWSNLATTNMLSNLDAGTYSVTVQDFNGCTAMASQEITEPDEIVVFLISQTDVSCGNGFDGTAEFNATGGAGGFNYSWSDGGQGASRFDLIAQSYDITVTDNTGCQKTSSVNIMEPDPITASILAATNPNCWDGDDGFIAVNATGGTGSISYDWGNGLTGATQNNLTAGSYTITITDDNNCTTTISENLDPIDSITITLDELIPVSCFEAQDGSISVNASGGASGFTYAWSNGQTGSTISNLSAQSYAVTVSDVNNCSNIAQYTIDQPTEMQLGLSATGITAAGAMDGTAECNPTGGTAPYTYIWSNGETAPIISDLDTGSYAVTVTDNNGCMKSGSVLINDFGCDMTLSSMIQKISCANSCDGEICVMPVGGSAPYSYDWGDSLPADSCVTNLCSGTYHVIVTDANNCSNSLTIELRDTLPIVILVDSINYATGGDMDGSIIISVEQNQGAPSFSWVEIETGQEISTNQQLLNVGKGYYSILVTDENGCTGFKDSIFVDMISSTNTVDVTSNHSAYPNPVRDMLYIEIEDLHSATATIEIVRITGETVRNEKVLLSERNQIDVADYSSGIYILKIHYDDTIWFSKFYKN